MRNHPKHVLKLRFVDRWKPTDEFGVVPEQFGDAWRTCSEESMVPGRLHPHIHEIEQQSQQSSLRENPKYEVPLTILAIDAKSVFDSTSSPEQQNQGEDDRAALEAAIIYESLSRLQAQL